MPSKYAVKHSAKQGHGSQQRTRDEMANSSEHLSRALSKLLRYEIDLSADHFASIDVVLGHLKGYTRADVLETVRTSYKNGEPRFEVNAETDCIRATQKVTASMAMCAAPLLPTKAKAKLVKPSSAPCARTGGVVPSSTLERPCPSMNDRQLEQCSKSLSQLLRGRVGLLHAQMSPDNFVPINAILQHLEYSREEVMEAALRSCKGAQPRFEIDISTDRIRATAKVSNVYAVPPNLVSARHEAVPEYWTNLQSGTTPQQLFRLVPAGEAEIEALRIGMTPGGNFGGRDQRASGNYTNLHLMCAWRIQHQGLWGKYAMEREYVQKFQVPYLNANGISIPQVRIRREFQEMMRRLPAKLEAGINEVYLSHGSKPQAVLSILNEGLNERFSSGLFGDGTYLAEDVAKNDQYCTYDVCQGASSESFQGPWKPRCACVDGASLELHRIVFDGTGTTHPGQLLYVFFCRVILGCPIRTQDGHTNMDSPHDSIWASEERELAPIVGSSPPVTHHSLIAETGGRISRFREFVVYHGDRIYPEYLVAYQRL